MVDFAVASGIFNVKRESSVADWEKYVLCIIENLDKNTSKGFAFNCLTKYSDAEYMKDYLKDVQNSMREVLKVWQSQRS